MVISYSNRKSGLQFGKKNSRNVCHSVEKKHSLAHVSICKRLIKEMKPEPDRWDYSSRSVRSGDKKIKQTAQCLERHIEQNDKTNPTYISEHKINQFLELIGAPTPRRLTYLAQTFISFSQVLLSLDPSAGSYDRLRSTRVSCFNQMSYSNYILPKFPRVENILLLKAMINRHLLP